MSLRMYFFTCQSCERRWEDLAEVELERGIPTEWEEIPRCPGCGTIGTPDLSFLSRAGGALECKHLSWSIFHASE